VAFLWFNHSMVARYGIGWENDVCLGSYGSQDME
jgi:hypothetical protein